MYRVILRLGCLWVLVLLTGCTLTDTLLEPAVPATAAPLWEDASAVMTGICFEAAFDAAGQVFVLRSAEALNEFYDLADHSELCRQPVGRTDFDFSTGRVLAGLWSTGVGCTAQHEVLATERDEVQQTITLRLRFITAGDCPYELVRPFWVALPDAQGYEINLIVE